MKTALWLQVPILTLLSLSTSLAGLCLLHHYRDCDPLQSGRIRAGDQLLPLHPGPSLPGPGPRRPGHSRDILRVSLHHHSNLTDPAGETLPVAQSDEQYFYLYRISYAWTSAIVSP